jgi:hypothetical protein
MAAFLADVIPDRRMAGITFDVFAFALGAL